ncbi:AAA family ATPase [archaeon]|jgi:septum site-determining protein MinD|nr:AAA family ATPase [archaeon]MBT4373966.1 AAA family ATPase [archaeon]MBT4532195.1 AAA family ATPase [archaeon]MBT7001952.1 AAA family ATPase [archaeon]MBT7282667.1 AAA family ATPase [archaeon]
MVETIGILSLKGGVGKTSSVVALGHALSEFGKKVLLLDANFSAPNLGIHLNILNPEKHLHAVMERKIHPKEAVQSLGRFDILPTKVFSKKVMNPLQLRDRIKNLKRNYDYVLIDSSPALNEETLAAMLASDKIFIVTTPDYSTLSMTLKSIKLAQQRGTKIDGIILNRVYDKDFELSLEDIEKTAEVPVLAVIPHDISMPEAQANFVSLLEHKPKSKGSEEYRKLAAAISGEKYKPKKMKRFWQWINPKKQEINRMLYYNRIFDSE